MWGRGLSPPLCLGLSGEGFFAEVVLRYQILPLHFVQGQNDISVLSLRGAKRRSNLGGANGIAMHLSVACNDEKRSA
jgi:hypothetical protein